MVFCIGFNQISDRDLELAEKLEVELILGQALELSKHVIAIVPNRPLPAYFRERAEYYISNKRDDLDEPDVVANAMMRQERFRDRFLSLV